MDKVRGPMIDHARRSEWEAWRQMCTQLKRLGLNINEARFSPFVRAVRLWGEELVQLREMHPEHTEKALAAARSRYAKYALDAFEVIDDV